MSPHPGYSWAVSPTRDWHTKAPNAYHWAAYEPDGTRHNGYSPDAEAAEVAAKHALSSARHESNAGAST